MTPFSLQPVKNACYGHQTGQPTAVPDRRIPSKKIPMQLYWFPA